MRPATASGAGNTAAYAYDGLGQRKSRTVNGTTTLSVTDIDGREVLEYGGATGQLLRWYAYDLGPNGLVSQTVIAAGAVASFIPDLINSVIGVVDTVAGTVTKSGYLPYGKSDNPPSQFGYTGQRYDAETGLYFYRSRHYSPFLGRFLESDPIGYGAGLHLYAYADNDPLNINDPYGLTSTPLANAQLRSFEASQQAVVDQALAATHIGLTALSFCPSVCGSVFALADAAVYVVQGQHLQAGISAATAVAGAVSSAGAVKVAAIGTVAAASALKTASGASKLAGRTPGVARGGVWSLGPGPRGLAVEAQLGGNLPAGFRVIDRFENGVATSIKSIDLSAPTYQNARALSSRLNGYVDRLAGWSGQTRPYAGITIQPSQVTGRTLEIAIPSGSMNAAQQAAFSAAAQRAQGHGINFVVRLVP